MNRSKKLLGSSTQTLLCASLLIGSVILYLYFLNLSVVHVVMRKEANLEQNRLRAEIAALESSYIEAQHLIAGRIASRTDFSVDSDKIFITRGETSLVLRDN
jgi:hypothetical protein